MRFERINWLFIETIRGYYIGTCIQGKVKVHLNENSELIHAQGNITRDSPETQDWAFLLNVWCIKV